MIIEVVTCHVSSEIHPRLAGPLARFDPPYGRRCGSPTIFTNAPRDVSDTARLFSQTCQRLLDHTAYFHQLTNYSHSAGLKEHLCFHMHTNACPAIYLRFTSLQINRGGGG
jgi:hypothetical protein